MRSIPPELITAILTSLSIGSAWFATWLARRGKREDSKIADRGQAFEQLETSLAAAREDLRYQRDEATAARAEKARIEADTRVRVEQAQLDYEQKWNRQMHRCRAITDTATRAIVALQQNFDSPERAIQIAESALQDVRKHNSEDHGVPPTETPN